VERIVLPFDSYATDAKMKHFGFVEVAAGDLVAAVGQPADHNYVRGGVRYHRWHLTQHRVSIVNATKGDFTRIGFEHVPEMPLVCPELIGHDPRPECTYDYPRPDLFSGFIDLAGGIVEIGDLELLPTVFALQKGDLPTKWPPARTPISLLLRLPFDEAETNAVVSITQVTGKNTELILKRGATVMMGNARERDITGDGAGDDPREHYIIYYNLADPKPTNPGLPLPQGVPMGACAGNTWP
jgi:hypothetical protein